MNRKKRKSPATPPASRSWRRLSVFALIGLGTLLYGSLIAYHISVPRAQASDNLLEKCRELCLTYGLIPTGDVAQDAQAYIEKAKPHDLKAPLAEILADREFTIAKSQPHPLLGNHPPAFQLSDPEGHQVSLNDLTATGPVVVVFYYGYSCSHCVAQLFALQQDLRYFRELGVRIVAISPDTPEKTATQFAKYGRFDFSVLSDADHRIALKYGVYTPVTREADEDMQHGTFIIDRSGKMIFANRGYQPFIDNKSLLFWLAGKVPDPESHQTAVSSTP